MLAGVLGFNGSKNGGILCQKLILLIHGVAIQKNGIPQSPAKFPVGKVAYQFLELGLGEEGGAAPQEIVVRRHDCA